MSEKMLYVQFSDGTIWGIPARIIADIRAKYYAENDSENTEYQAEFDYTMSDDYEIKDWATGNMNWEDVKEHAKQFGGIEVDYDAEWMNAKRWIQDAVDPPPTP